MVTAHQEKRKNVTDQMVLEYMSPRPLNFPTKEKSKKIKPFLEAANLTNLEAMLETQSYVYEYMFSELDVVIASHVDENGIDSFTNIKRWLHHVDSQEEKPLNVAKSVKNSFLSQFGKLLGTLP